MAIRALTAVFLLLLSVPVFALEVAGIKVPDTDQQLVLNGAGLRKRVFFQVYVIGLYLSEKKSAAAEAVAATGAKRIAIHMMRNADAGDFAGALTDGMKQNVSEAEMTALEPRVKQLVALMAEMKEAKEGMRITKQRPVEANTCIDHLAQVVGADAVASPRGLHEDIVAIAVVPQNHSEACHASRPMRPTSIGLPLSATTEANPLSGK